VGNGRIFQRDAHHFCPSEFAAFADGIGNLTGLSETNPDFTAPISNNDQRAEIEAASAFHDLGRAIDKNHLLHQFLSLAAEIGVRFGWRPAAPATAWAASAWCLFWGGTIWFSFFGHNNSPLINN
jgi:hypothetical protein